MRRSRRRIRQSRRRIRSRRRKLRRSRRRKRVVPDTIIKGAQAQIPSALCNLTKIISGYIKKLEINTYICLGQSAKLFALIASALGKNIYYLPISGAGSPDEETDKKLSIKENHFCKYSQKFLMNIHESDKTRPIGVVDYTESGRSLNRLTNALRVCYPGHIFVPVALCCVPDGPRITQSDTIVLYLKGEDEEVKYRLACLLLSGKQLEYNRSFAKKLLSAILGGNTDTPPRMNTDGTKKWKEQSGFIQTYAVHEEIPCRSFEKSVPPIQKSASQQKYIPPHLRKK